MSSQPLAIFQDANEIKRDACAFLRRMRAIRQLTRVSESIGVKADTLRKYANSTRWPRLETAIAVLKFRDQMKSLDDRENAA